MKDFDCVEMKRRIQAEIYDEIRDLTDHARDNWFRRQVEVGSLGEWWKQLKSVDEVRAEEARRRETG